MKNYAGAINVQGTTIKLIESFDSLDSWLKEDDVMVLRSWLKEPEPLTFTMLDSNNLTPVKIDSFCNDTKGGKIYQLESSGTEQPQSMRTTDLRLVIPTLLHVRPSMEGDKRVVGVAVTNTLSVPYNEIRASIEKPVTERCTRLDRVDIHGPEEVRPYATEGLIISDNVSLECVGNNLFVVSDEGADVIITVDQPQHNDYLATITYYLSSSFDDTLINTLLALDLPYTKMNNGETIEYYLRVEDYFSSVHESQFI